MALRQLASFVALPFTVAVLVPIWIGRRSGSHFVSGSDLVSLAFLLGGYATAAAGALLVTWSLYYFWTRGRGTLAPWDPPRRFVVSGPYCYVRNPMIGGVILVLFGEAMVLRSLPHLEWAGLFLLLNAVYIPLLEEPMLRARFGAPYTRYSGHVRRFLPRLTPYESDSEV
jgi:protein-S-isoprenylcysteine O-methyltransferase Ste14